MALHHAGREGHVVFTCLACSFGGDEARKGESSLANVQAGVAPAGSSVMSNTVDGAGDVDHRASRAFPVSKKLLLVPHRPSVAAGDGVACALPDDGSELVMSSGVEQGLTRKNYPPLFSEGARRR